MSVAVQPMSGYIVAVPHEAQTKTNSGLYVPGQTADKPKIAKVLAVGKDVAEVSVGDQILYKNDYEATGVKIEKDEYLVIDQKNVVAILNVGKV